MKVIFGIIIIMNSFKCFGQKDTSTQNNYFIGISLTEPFKQGIALFYERILMPKINLGIEPLFYYGSTRYIVYSRFISCFPLPVCSPNKTVYYDPHNFFGIGLNNSIKYFINNSKFLSFHFIFKNYFINFKRTTYYHEIIFRKTEENYYDNLKAFSGFLSFGYKYTFNDNLNFLSFEVGVGYRYSYYSHFKCVLGPNVISIDNYGLTTYINIILGWNNFNKILNRKDAKY